jgi:hypothetical protein
MDYLLDDCLKYLADESGFVNIDTNYDKIVGIESYLGYTNENGKKVGRVLLMKNAKGMMLNTYVQFLEDNIKWSSSITNDGYGFYIVKSHFAGKYKIEIKLKVDVLIRDGDKLNIEKRELTFDQFKQNRMYQYYYKNKVPHCLVSAYRNFYRLLKKNKYYYAINSTVKNYFITEEQLVKVISDFNNERNRIKKEWYKYLHHQSKMELTQKKVAELLDRGREKEQVIELDNFRQ